MKKLLLCIPLLTIWGCSGSLPKALCPEAPANSLENSQLLSFRNPTVANTATVRAGEQIGYIFQGSSDAKLKYRTEQPICIWVYSPSLEIINNGKIQGPGTWTIDLTENGKYTIQVSAAKGSENFNLTTTLLKPLAESEAIDLIKTWLEAKKRIFAPPYDSQLAAQFTTGQRYRDILGSIDWLRQYNGYYRYSSQDAKPTGKFSSTLDKATIEAIVTEARELYVGGQLDPGASTYGLETSKDRFGFQRDNDVWKIIEYESL